ncbi:E3 ubiquitin-protein ligase Mdm2-like isoform X3 [Amblyomma americanum]
MGSALARTASSRALTQFARNSRRDSGGRYAPAKLYMPSNGLMECLKTGGVTSGLLSLQQIMDCLRDYIRERKLFDPMCPTRILCGQDPLGKVLGVEHFLAIDLLGLLVKQIRAVPTQHVVSQGALKRESQLGACEGSATIEAKRPCLEPDSTTSGTSAAHASPVTIHIPPSPPYDSGAETVYSIQGRETDVVKDTSDDLWFLDESSGDCNSSSDSEATQERIMQAAALAAELIRQQRRGAEDDYSDQDSDCPFEVEYEIEEASDHGDKAASSSDSDIEAMAQAEILICVNDDDAQFWADSSDSYSSDSEIGDADLWQCRLCGLRCEPHGLSAVQRYCTGCWKGRFGWLPDRTERHPPQKKRRRAQRRTSRQMNRVRTNHKSSSTKLESRHQLNSAGEESRPGSCSEKNEASGSSNTESNSGGSQESFSDPSVSEMLAPQGDSSQTASSGTSQELADDWSQPGCSTDRSGGEGTLLSISASDLCTICLVRPKCGILVHGNTSHRLSCYKCAKLLHKRNQPCPVCRRRIQRVVRNFDA